MARVEVRSFAWGFVWEKAVNRALSIPVAGILAEIDTSVYDAASGGSTIDPADFKTDADGYLPGFVETGSYVVSVNGGDPFAVEAPFGTDAGGDVAGPGSATDDHVATFNGASGKIIQDSGLSIDTDDTLGADSDQRLATQAAIKAYVDAAISDVVAGVSGGIIQVTHEWAIGGEIKVPSGTTDSIAAWVASVKSGTAARITRVRYFIEGGTSATFKLQLNGVDIPGLTGLSATPTAASATPTTGPDGDLADLDKVKPIVTAVSGTPMVLTIAMTVEYTP